MDVVEFIDEILIKQIKEIQENHKYLSFGLIAGGIEFLGALLDSYNFDEGYQSKARFNKALRKFFDPPYHAYADPRSFLYTNLRCGMQHVVIPQNELVLGERKDSKKYRHLEKCNYGGNERLFLMAEAFYEDFKAGCNKAISMIRDKSILNLPEVKESPPKKRDILSLITPLLIIE